MSWSHKLLRRAIADQIEPRSWGIGTTTSSGSTTTLVASGFALTRGDQNALDGGWVLITSGALLGEQRPIRESGLDVSTGTITVATAFSGSPASGVEFEVHLRYPAKRDSGSLTIAGYREMINDALARFWVQDDLAVSGVSGQTRYPLDTTTYPFLDEPERVLDVIDPLGTDNVKRSATQSWYLDDDAEAPALVLGSGYSTGQTFYLRVARPAWTRIKIGGTWTEVTAASPNGGQLGVSADSDETHARKRDVLAFAIAESMNHLGMAQPAFQTDEWEGRRKYWAAVAAQAKVRRLPRKPRPRVRAAYIGGGLMGWGR